MFYKFCTTACRIFLHIFFKYRVVGKENIPCEGAFILAPNHRSNFDPVMVGSAYGRKINFMAKSELFKFKPFGALLSKLGAFPIQRGKSDVGAIKGAFSILKSGNVLLMFPQGRRYKDGSRGKLRTGVTVIAHKMQVPIVPVYIDSDYKFRHKAIINFGVPVTFDEYYNQKLDDALTQQLTEKVYDGIFMQPQES